MIFIQHGSSHFLILLYKSTAIGNGESGLCIFLGIVRRNDSMFKMEKRKFKFSRRLAALTLGIERVAEAKQKRGLFP